MRIKLYTIYKIKHDYVLNNMIVDYSTPRRGLNIHEFYIAKLQS